MRRSDKRTSTDERTLGRRGFFTGAAMTAAAAAAAKIVADAKPAFAADGQPLLLGAGNNATKATSLFASPPSGTGDFALRVVGGNDFGGAVFGQGFGAVSIGVGGVSPTVWLDPNQPFSAVDQTAGVWGFGGSDPGVLGTSESGPGLKGVSVTGPGLCGLSSSSAADPNQPYPIAGVVGDSAERPAVLGVSIAAPGVWGRSQSDSGVLGVFGSMDWSDPNDVAPLAGVFGRSVTGAGVSGLSTSGIGIRGTAVDPTQPGVRAENRASGGIGLQVLGRSSFSTGGVSTIPKRASKATVQTPSMLATSVVVVTLTSDAGPRYVRWVEIHPDGFTVHLSGRASKSATFNWLVLN